MKLVLFLIAVFCYPIPSFAQFTGSGSFIYTEEIDPMTDEDTSSIITFNSDNAALMWRCQSGDLLMLVGTKEFLDSAGDDVALRYRFDKQPVENWQMWTVLPGNSAVMAPPEFVDPINSRVAQASTISFEISDYEDQSHYTSFDLDGFSESIKQLPCNKTSP